MQIHPAPHGPWPRPPRCVPAELLDRPPGGARVTVAGIVILRQRPGTAKGVIFVTLEDETGVVNVIVWRALYERFRRAVISGRMLRVTGRVQRDCGVTHVLAEEVEDISWMLDRLLDEHGITARGPADPRHGQAYGQAYGRHAAPRPQEADRLCARDAPDYRDARARS